MCQKYLEDSYINKCHHILKIFTRVSVNIDKHIALSIAYLHCWKKWKGMLTMETFLEHFFTFYFIELVFTPCKAEQPLQTSIYKKKKYKKIKP